MKDWIAYIKSIKGNVKNKPFGNYNLYINLNYAYTNINSPLFAIHLDGEYYLVLNSVSNKFEVQYGYNDTFTTKYNLSDKPVYSEYWLSDDYILKSK